jgi:hypothetical protein
VRQLPVRTQQPPSSLFPPDRFPEQLRQPLQSQALEWSQRVWPEPGPRKQRAVWPRPPFLVLERTALRRVRWEAQPQQWAAVQPPGLPADERRWLGSVGELRLHRFAMSRPAQPQWRAPDEVGAQFSLGLALLLRRAHWQQAARPAPRWAELPSREASPRSARPVLPAPLVSQLREPGGPVRLHAFPAASFRESPWRRRRRCGPSTSRSLA